jgi:hypothetical protein
VVSSQARREQRTRKLTNAKEDHLTEFIAASLALSAAFRRNYSALVLGSFAAANGWSTPEIVDVQTQVAFNAGHDNPDMILRLADGHVISVEHKIEAQETPGPESGEPDQLRRYLAIPSIDGLVFVRETSATLHEEVLNHRKYVRPAHRDHFLWRDFYPLLEKEGGWFYTWLARAFNTLGYRPPHPKLGDWRSPEATFASVAATQSVLSASGTTRE